MPVSSSTMTFLRNSIVNIEHCTCPSQWKFLQSNSLNYQQQSLTHTKRSQLPALISSLLTCRYKNVLQAFEQETANQGGYGMTDGNPSAEQRQKSFICAGIRTWCVNCSKHTNTCHLTQWNKGHLAPLLTCASWFFLFHLCPYESPNMGKGVGTLKAGMLLLCLLLWVDGRSDWFTYLCFLLKRCQIWLYESTTLTSTSQSDLVIWETNKQKIWHKLSIILQPMLGFAPGHSQNCLRIRFRCLLLSVNGRLDWSNYL